VSGRPVIIPDSSAPLELRNANLILDVHPDVVPAAYYDLITASSVAGQFRDYPEGSCGVSIDQSMYRVGYIGYSEPDASGFALYEDSSCGVLTTTPLPGEGEWPWWW